MTHSIDGLSAAASGRAGVARQRRGTGRGKALMRGAAALAILAALAGCEKDARLPGERLSIDQMMGGPAAAPLPGAAPIAIPAAITNAEWNHAGGSAGHQIGNVTLSAQPQLVWSTGIGAGDSKRQRIATDPVVGGGRAYAMDALAKVSAVSPNGQVLWSTSLVPSDSGRNQATGGGLAYDGGRVYATSGYGELVVLDAATGGVIWRQKVDGAIGGAPAVSGGMVYVATRNSTGWAVRAADGRVMWQSDGLPTSNGVMGVAAPAVAGNTVVFPFSSGMLSGFDRDKGQKRWDVPLTGRRTGYSYATVTDLTGDPVIANGMVYGGTSSGRLAAVALESGKKAWEIDEGALSPVVAVGGALFVVTDQNHLLRLNAGSGAKVWDTELPNYVPYKKEKKRRDIVRNYGPVLAGGRLVVASSDGGLRSYDPVSGKLLGQVDIPGGAASAPAVAGGLLYVVNRDGKLLAFR